MIPCNRPRLLLALSTMLLIQALFVFGEAHAAGEDWPMLKNNHQRNGFSLSVCPPTHHLLWEYETPEWIYSSPVVADNVVLASGRDCKLYALDLWTGQLLWNFQYGSSFCYHSHSSPTVSGGRIFIGVGWDGIYCIELSSGALEWYYDLDDAVGSSPLVADGKVFFTRHNTDVIALDANTGTLLWNYDTSGSNYKASPAYFEGRIYAPTYDGRIVVLDGDTGGLIASNDITISAVQTPAIAGDKLFASARGQLVALNLADAEILWSQNTGYPYFSSPSVGYGKVFAGGDQLRAFEIDTGALVWSYDAALDSDVAIADGKVIANFGQMVVFDQATGDIVWQAPGGSTASSPAVASGAIVVGGATIKCYYTHPHDVALDSLDIPFPVEPDEQVVVSVNLTNEGLSDETDVQVQLLADKVVIATQTIAFLPSMSARIVSFDWTAPSIATVVELEVQAQIAAAEGRSDNNRLIHQVGVGGKTLHVPTEYETVTTALDAADPGDTIRIGNGNYTGTLTIKKSHMRLIAEDPGGVTIHADSHFNGTITIEAEYCEVSGLSVVSGTDNYSPAGIEIHSANNRISNCTISGKGIGIIMGMNAVNNVIDGCTVSNNVKGGMKFYSYAENNLIQNSTIAQNGGAAGFVGAGVMVAGRNNRFVACNISENQTFGLSLVDANDCQFIDLTIRANGSTGLRISRGDFGQLGRHLVQGCTIEDNATGISVTESTENVFRDNRLQSNTYNVQFGSMGYRQDIDDSNLIEGKPLVYLRDQSDVTIDGSQQDIGMLIAVDCSQVHIQNATLSGNYQGLLLVDTNDSIIENCYFANNYEGIYVTYYSSSNIIRQCQVTDNVFGIRLFGEGQHNRIEDCLVRDNSDSGIFIDTNSRQVEVVRCELTLNGKGIYTEGSSDHLIRDSRIHHNTDGVVFGRNSFDGSLTGCFIFKNTADGVGAYADQRIYNNTIIGNGGCGISARVHALIANCVIRGNGTNLSQADLSVVYSNVEGGYAGDGNIDQDPLFVDAANNDFRLQAHSPGVDAGMFQDVAVLSLDGNGDGWAYPDMGAYEYPSKPDIFGFSLGDRFVYTTHAGTATYDSERIVSANDLATYDVPTSVVSLSRDGSELQKEWYERQDEQVVLRKLEDPTNLDYMEFTDGLVRYWYPVRVGEVRNSNSRLRGMGIPNDLLQAGLEAIVLKKEILSLDGKSFAAFKIQYTLRIWGDTVDEQRSTFYEWLAPYLGVVKYSDDHGSDTLRSYFIGGGYIDSSGSIMAFYDILDDPSIDADMDGIPDLEEKGPFLNDPSYDGNGDTIPDLEQSNVFSSYTAGGDYYATLAVPAPLTIEAAEVLNGPDPSTALADIAFTCGFFRFVINELADDGLAELTLFLEEGMQPNTYYKFGPTPGDTSDHWYEFLYDGDTGAELDDHMVRLHFLDAHRGDDLLEKDGMIVDIGAPGFAINEPGSDDPVTDTNTDGGGGGGCFISGLVFVK